MIIKKLKRKVILALSISALSFATFFPGTGCLCEKAGCNCTEEEAYIGILIVALVATKYVDYNIDKNAPAMSTGPGNIKSKETPAGVIKKRITGRGSEGTGGETGGAAPVSGC